MMDTGQRVELVKMRVQQRRRRQENILVWRLSLLSAMLCCCLIYVTGNLTGKSPGRVQGMSGATMLLQNAGGYVLVGVVSFAAAVVITVLCLQGKKENSKQDKEK